MSTIRELFSDRRPIDRPIEKVIDYTADDPKRLAREIDEYIVTERLEDSFRRFIEVYEDGVQREDVTEVGVWVSGFYGSGKSSFTKYLGFALDPDRQVGDGTFLESLVAHFKGVDLQQLYRTTAKRFPATVVMLDLARDQLVESTTTPITNVLYSKVLQRIGYSKVPKLADVEVRLDEDGRLEQFHDAYRDRFPGKGEWTDVHNDPLIGPARAAQLVPSFLDDFPTPESFRQQHYQDRQNVTELADRMIQLVQRKTGRDRIIFLVDEVGQYVAPRGDLILNLDGLVRSFKELGRGKVWLVATAQQTLTEIVEKAILNSPDLFKLRARFPISIELDAADIKEITHRRLLTKHSEGEGRLRQTFRDEGEPLKLQTLVEGFGSASGTSQLDADTFAAMYPFLPLHFDLVMALIRRLARRTGGTGLRSAIRVVQDLLVDASHALPAGTPPIAERPFGWLACADDIFDTLRADIGKELPHVVEGVARVEKHPTLGQNPLAVRVAKAIAALQPLDDFPRTADNLAAVLYPAVGETSLVEPVQEILQQLVETRELGIVELKGEQGSEQAGVAGYLFLSDKVRPLQQSREAHQPTGAEKRLLQIELLRRIFDPQPETRLENVKTVRAGLFLGSTPVAGESADIRFLLEPVLSESWNDRIEDLNNDTRRREDLKPSIFWLVRLPADIDEMLEEACRSAHIGRTTSEHDADRDVAQYVRAERRREERLRESVTKRLRAAMHAGVFVYHGLDRPVGEFDGDDLIKACDGVLAKAAAAVFEAFRYAPLAAKTNQAARFLEWERLDRMPRERDPLALVETKAGQPRIKTTEPPLSEALRVFTEKVDAAGTGRLQGSFVQDHFAEPPYGWTKDTTRYLFAALLTAGEIEVHTPSGVLRTPGQNAVEAFRNTASFNRVGLAPRGTKPPLEALDRAARLLEGLFGVEVLPLEDHISRAVRAEVPKLMEKVGSLPDRLRLLGLPGEERARSVLQHCSDLLQEDAGGAASILGAPQSTLPSDVKWAREAVETLDADGEETLRNASALRREMMEIAELFPDLHDIAPKERVQTIEEVLASESFHEKMADLRAAVLALRQAAGAAYIERHGQLEGDLRAARKELEAMKEWAALEEEDREAIGRRFTVGDDLPPEPNPDKLITDLRRLLTKAARLPTTLAESRKEVRRRAPPGESSTGGGAKGALQTVTFRTLMPAEPLGDAEAVERWVGELKRRLVELVEIAPVRLVDREDD